MAAKFSKDQLDLQAGVKPSISRIAGFKKIEEEVQADSTSGAGQTQAEAVQEDQPMLLAQADISGEPMLLAQASPTQGAGAGGAALLESSAGGGGSVLPWLAGAAVVGLGTAGLVSEHHNDDDNHAPAPPAPPAPTAVAVVVERDGAWIDSDADGVHDEGETTAAVFQGGNADLASKEVTIQFNDVPETAINLTGFGVDDMLEFDLTAMFENGVIVESRLGTSSIMTASTTGLSPTVNFSITSGTDFPFLQFLGSGTDRNGNQYSDVYRLIASETPIISGYSVMAYWDDAGNALNDWHNIVPDFTGDNQSEVGQHVNNGDYAATYGGNVDFIFSPPQPEVNVIVNSCGAYIDGGVIGQFDSCDWCNPAAFGSGGNADLAANSVTIHFHEAPSSPLDFSGFTANDLIEVDINAYYHGTGSTTLGRSTQFTTAKSTTTLSGRDAIDASSYTFYTLLGETSQWVRPAVKSSSLSSVMSVMIGVIGTSGGGSFSRVANFGDFNPVQLNNVDFVVYTDSMPS